MSKRMSPRVRSLLRQATKVAGDNKRLAARQLYQQLLEEAPDLPAAWLGLAEVAEPEEQEEIYEKVLALDPDNHKATQALARLRGELPPLPETMPVAEEVEPSGLETVDPTELDSERDWAQEKTTSERFDHVEATTATQDLEPAHEPLQSPEDAESVACYRHPDRQTNLRCSNCGRPICSDCVNPTPVGYRCIICIRELEDRLYEANAMTYLRAGAVAFGLGLVAALIMSFIGIWIVAIFIGAGAGSLIGQLAFRAGGRRRGRYLPLLVASMVVVTGLPFLISNLLGIGIYLFLATSAAYYQLR